MITNSDNKTNGGSGFTRTTERGSDSESEVIVTGM